MNAPLNDKLDNTRCLSFEGASRRTVMYRLPSCRTLVTSPFVARLPVARTATYACAVNVESFDERSGGIGEIDDVPDRPIASRRSSGPVAWLKDTNHSPAVVALLARGDGLIAEDDGLFVVAELGVCPRDVAQ